MSFHATVEAFRNRSKTVTRRLRWNTLRPGDLLMGVNKSPFALRPGETLDRLGVVEVLDTRRERLDLIDLADVKREGLTFVGMPTSEWPRLFVELMGEKYGIAPDTIVNRIEFRHLKWPTIPNGVRMPRTFDELMFHVEHSAEETTLWEKGRKATG